MQPAAITERAIAGNQFQRGEKVIRTNPIPSFLTGQGKVSQYHSGIFGDMQYRF